MIEAITLFCTILGTIIAYVTYKGSTSDALEESRKLLLEKFELLQEINKKLIEDLYLYGRTNGSYDMVFMQGLTLKQCLEILEKVKHELLTSENQEALKETKSKMRIDNIYKNIEIQIKHHSEVRTVFDYYIKPGNRNF